ncbi:hypothetical protein D3C78_897660 [compost metagenome]
MLLVTWKTLLQVLGEGVRADIAEYVDMPVVAVLQLLQDAILPGLVEEVVDRAEQAVVVAGGYGPGQPALIAEIEADPHVGEVDLVHRQFVGVDQGQVDLADIDLLQQVDHFVGVGFLIGELWEAFLQLRQLAGMTAALEHDDVFADQVFRTGGALLAVAIDHLGGDFQVGVGEADRAFVGSAGSQAGGGQIGAVGAA